MQQFDFCATWNDDWVLLEQLVEEVAPLFIPDKWFADREVELYSCVNDTLKSELVDRRRMFLLPEGTALNVTRGLVQQHTGPRKGWHRVQHTLLADSLALTLPACYSQDSVISIGSGSVFLANEYFNFVTQQWESPSETLRNFFARVCAILQSQLTLVQSPRKRIWVGAEAVDLVSKGKAKIVDQGV